ncbi:MAG: hypothetical protein IIC50_04830 [Planctomycetes bacterium]|nr:hypothetical protein [Planctomycetota bacterium]
MKRSKLFLMLCVLALSALMIWRIGFHDLQSSAQTILSLVRSAAAAEAPEADRADAEPNAATPAPKQATEEEKEEPSDPNSEQVTANTETPPAPADANEANAESESEEEPLEALNLKDVEVKDLIEKLAKWTDKAIIPDEKVMKQKITIYAPHKVTRKEALALIYSALRTKGFVAEHTDNVIYLKPIDEAKLGQVPTVGSDEHLALFENKEQIVQKFFKLKNYSPSRMGEILAPLVGEYGDVSADEITGTVIVIDTVANLIRIKGVIAEFDVPEAEQSVSEVIQVHNGDPIEIVQLIRILMGGETPAKPRSSSSSSRSSSRRGIIRFSPGGSRSSSSSKKSKPASSPIMGKSQVPIYLHAEPRRNWIIARASAKDMVVVREWVQKLDVAEPVVSETETVSVVYADAREVATRIEDALRDMPGHELRPSILVRALEQSRQIMIIGRKDLRDMVKKLIAEIDIPPGEYETQNFSLKYADSTQIKENIDSLYGDEGPQGYDSYYYYRYGRGSQNNPGDMVKVIDFPMMQQVTVICSPANMRKIEVQIEEWDQPLDVDQVKPRIVEVRNSDPQQIATLLTKLFSEDQSSSNDFSRFFFFGNSSESKKKIIGPLYGQLTFEHVPGTKKIIIISKIPEAYDIIIDLVRELDAAEMAEVPNVIRLKYADPEALAERLNALFNESGTNASIRFDRRGLSDMDTGGGQGSDNQNNNNRNQNNNNNNNNNDLDSYRPWWNEQRLAQGEEPISNVIGKVRFIPDTHSKSILVLAPREFMETIENLVRELDVPGKQVLIKVVIVEVEHSSATSLGVRLSSNPGAFPAVGESGVLALTQLTQLFTEGSVAAAARTTSPLSAVGTGAGSIVGGTADVYAMVDFLAKTVDAKILNQQSLWTKDNEEASFFKGDLVAFNAGSTVGSQGFSTQDIRFDRVGMWLQIRPSITPEDHVDMEIRVTLSQLKSETVNGQPVRGEMETTTKMIVKNGETLMMGGILFQRDSHIARKVPLLGDIPLLGALFKHKELIQSNTELIVFITPQVIGVTEGRAEKTAELMQEPLEILGGVEAQMDEMFEQEDVYDDD